MSTREYSIPEPGGNGGSDHGGEPPGAPGRVSGGGAAATAGPLSKLHIRPQDWPGVYWCEGASILKVSKGGHCAAPEGGPRAEITGFSADSRRRLLYTIGRIQRGAQLPWFVTLTWPNEFPSARDSKRHLAAFLRRLKRAFPGMGLIWKLEPQQRGAPHYHMLVWGAGCELMVFVPKAWYDVAGGKDYNHYLWHAGCLGNKHCCQPVRSWRGVWNYAAKYLGKIFEVSGWDRPGRYWAVVNRHNIPFGQERMQEVTRTTAVQVQRYQRRFSGLKQKGRSLTTFCDADQWIDRLDIAAPAGTMGIGDQPGQH